MIPNYAYWGLPNYTKFINNHTPVVPPQPNITPAQVQSSVVPPQPNASRVQNYVSGARSFNASSQPYIASSQNISLKNTGSNRSESGNYEPVFNLLGINLYFDDILILCLLFFLYTEQANDFSLYLALIFLLMC